MAEAVLHVKHRGVKDPDQAYILGELIRYLDHPSSGIMEFDAFPKAWPVRQWVPKPPKLQKTSHPKADKKEINEKQVLEPQDSEDLIPVPWAAYIQPSADLKW